jgi:hypothetical protein
MLIDRYQELSFLNELLTRDQPGPGQLILLYGRRRVGKTELLKHWARQSGLHYSYWAAGKEPAALQRRSFLSSALKIPEDQVMSFDSWPSLWRWLAPALAKKTERQILVMDQLSHAAAADPELLSALQHAWDHHLKDSQIVLLLCGSQMASMEALTQNESPLFGRFTGQWHLQPLSFSSLQSFFPAWSVEERIALYSIVGGMPAYLEWLDPDLNLVQNIAKVILKPGNLFSVEPVLQLHDELRDPSTYQAILRAISCGHHTVKAISKDCLLEPSNITFHLGKLQDLQLIERRLPVTLRTSQQSKSKQGRYHVRDPYFRFYYRFLRPHLNSLMSIDETTSHIQNELRAFVSPAFTQLAQAWMLQAARADRLPLSPEAVGSHWSRRVQVDAVAIDHESRQILLGECKWGADEVSPQMIRELIEQKGPKLRSDLLNGAAWTFHYAVFAQAGFSPEAVTSLAARDALGVDLRALDSGLSK